jgi:hypothetical protein
MCLQIVLESAYECTDCYEWHACSKCYKNIHLYHSAKTQGDEKPHSFKLLHDEAVDSSPQESGEKNNAQGPVVERSGSAETGNDATEDLSDEDETLDLSDEDES